MNINVGDTLEMKKPHPCGNRLFTVTRIGMDFKLECTLCRHEFMISRAKAEKSVKRIIMEE